MAPHKTRESLRPAAMPRSAVISWEMGEMEMGQLGALQPLSFSHHRWIFGFDPLLRPQGDQGDQGDQLAIEEEGGIRRDWPYSLCSVGQL